MSRGYTLMADIVIALAAKPMTAKQAHYVFCSRMSLGPLRRMLRRLMDGRVLRVVGWVGTRNAERVYGVGSEPGIDAPVCKRLNGTQPKPIRLPTEPAKPMCFVGQFCDIWHCLETPCTVAEICEDVSSSPGVIRGLLNHLRECSPKLVRIAGYEPTTQRRVIYERGSKPDARRPPRISEHQIYIRQKRRREAVDLHRVFTFQAQPLTNDFDFQQRA